MPAYGLCSAKILKVIRQIHLYIGIFICARAPFLCLTRPYRPSASTNNRGSDYKAAYLDRHSRPAPQEANHHQSLSANSAPPDATPKPDKSAQRPRPATVP